MKLAWFASVATTLAAAVYDGFDVAGDDPSPATTGSVTTLDAFPDYALRVHPLDSLKPKYKFDDVNSYTGYLDVELLLKHLFYWFFESRGDPATDPVILWLNGGPGCSSLLGLFGELGPSFINASIVPEFNPFSWNSNALVLFLDQPVGVGYSYTDDPLEYHNLTYAAAKDVYAFLELFFARFPQFQGREFHIAGESYGGHYVPAFASEILHHPERSFNLTSVLIGNGITDSLVQWPYYQPMVCGLGGEPAVVSPQQCRDMAAGTPACQQAVELCYDFPNLVVCRIAGEVCSNLYHKPFLATGLSPYDIRVNCSAGSDLCDARMDYVTRFLLQPDVIRQVGAQVPLFQPCNNSVGYAFGDTADGVRPFQGFVAELLDHDVPVLVYAGDKDWICNWLGNEAWTKLLAWKGHAEFARAQPHPWVTAEGEPAGVATNYNHFTFLRVFDAGHMVPADQPQHALDMLAKWLAKDYAFAS